MKPAITILMTLIIVAALTIPTDNLLALVIPVKFDERFGIGYFNITINSMSDYSYILIIFMGEGVYAYGYAILKDPDHTAPILYGINGTQNDWFKITGINVGENIILIILIDFTNNTIYYRVNDNVKIVRCSKIQNLSKYVVVIDSMGVDIPRPRVVLNEQIIAKTQGINPNRILSGKISLVKSMIMNLTIIYKKIESMAIPSTITTTATTTTTTTEAVATRTYPTTTTSIEPCGTTTPYNALKQTSYIALLIIVLATLSMILIYHTIFKRRSHGP